MPLTKARDLRSNIQTMGFEKGVVHTLEMVLEERVQEQQHMRELTDMVARCIDEMDKLVHIGDAIRNSIDEMKRIMRQGDEHGEHS